MEKLPTDYTSLSDEHLAQLSAFYVALKAGLGSFPEPYEEIRAAGGKPSCEIYAELAHRISDRGNRNKSELLHALYHQSSYVPYHAYGKYGKLEWISKAIFDTIDKRIASGTYEIAILDLILDTRVLLEEFEPVYQAYIGNAVAQWEVERKKDAWLSLPVSEVAHRIRILTNYNDFLTADVEDPVSRSKHLLKTFSSRILDEADASVLIAYREALRNTYYFGTVSTKYFSELERKAGSMFQGSLPYDLLQAMLTVDRLERELIDKVCLVG